MLVHRYGKMNALRRHLVNFETYVRQNSASIVNYSERHRYGERLSTGFVESTVYQVISKRFVKRQRMQWTKKGAHLLVQARTKVLNEEWGDCFRQRYPGFRQDPEQPVPIAA